MTHDEALELIGAAPQETSAELLEHLHGCPQCVAVREEMLAFDVKLRRALELDWQKMYPAAPPGAPPTGPGPIGDTPAEVAPRVAVSTPLERPRTPGEMATVSVLRRPAPAPLPRQKPPRVFALAASIAATLMIGATLWLTRPTDSLADEIVTHVEGEPQSWQQTQAVAPERLEAVLRKSGVKLGTGMEPVVYANSCWFRGHFVPHVVVTTKDGPVTVMILAHEQVAGTQRFDESGFSGLLMPASAGSIAVLSRTRMALEQPAAEVVRALQSAK